MLASAPIRLISKEAHAFTQPLYVFVVVCVLSCALDAVAQGPSGRFASLDAVVGDCTWSEALATRSMAMQSIFYDSLGDRIESLGVSGAVAQTQRDVAQTEPGELHKPAPSPLRGLSCRMNGGRASCWPDSDVDTTVLANQRASGIGFFLPVSSAPRQSWRETVVGEPCTIERPGPSGVQNGIFRPPRF